MTLKNWVLLLVAAMSLAAAEPPQQFASLGDFRLESGEVIRDCKIGYRTVGTLNAGKSNAVLFPTWFTGSSQQLVSLVGASQLVAPSHLFVILGDSAEDDHRFRRERGHYSGMIPVSRRSEATLVL